MAKIDPSIFDEISRWIPSERLEDYWRFLAKIKDLPEEDPIMRCILALGIFTVIVGQAPGEVAKQLDKFQQIVVPLLKETQLTTDRLLAALQERTTSLVALHKNVVTQAHIDKVVQEISRMLEQRLEAYLQPLAKDEMEAFLVKARSIDKWYAYLSNMATQAMSNFNDLEPTLKKQIQQLVQMRSDLQKSIREDAANQIALEHSRRPWPWILGTMAGGIAVILASGLAGAWIHHLVEHSSH